jgi:hypothetical protein
MVQYSVQLLGHFWMQFNSLDPFTLIEGIHVKIPTGGIAIVDLPAQPDINF